MVKASAKRLPRAKLRPFFIKLTAIDAEPMVTIAAISVAPVAAVLVALATVLATPVEL